MRYLLLPCLLILTACGSWHTGDVARAPGGAQLPATTPSSIVVTEGDLTRPYTVIGDVNVTVRKTTIFDKDPTHETVNDALRNDAAELGANAVILVRYGQVGLSMWSYGAMDGRGRAVVYK